MNRYTALAVLVAGSLPFTVGCATKKYRPQRDHAHHQ